MIVMAGIVMKQKEILHFGLDRERHGVVRAAMSPAYMVSIFDVIVLRIHDRHVGGLDEFDQLLVMVLGEP